MSETERTEVTPLTHRQVFWRGFGWSMAVSGIALGEWFAVQFWFSLALLLGTATLVGALAILYTKFSARRR
jgi:hypothetical protein